MKSIVNFRDLGEIKVDGGKKVKSKLILRSGALTDLSLQDMTALKDEYNLKYVVDLRASSEIKEKPNVVIDGVSYINFDIIADSAQFSTLRNFQDRADKLKPKNTDDHLLSIYKDFVTTSSAIKGFKGLILTLLNEDEGSILFHCAAGKDRTGFGAAVILKILGVSDEDIMADYLLTIKARKEANAKILEDFKNEGYDEVALEAMAVLFNIKEEYLSNSFATIDEKYGSFDKFVNDILEITQEQIESLKARYLE